MEWKRRWWTRGQLAEFAKALEDVLSSRRIAPDMGIAMAGRNWPAHCFAILSLQAHARPISMLYAFQAPAALARDVENTRFAALIIDEQDWSQPVQQAANESGTVAIVLGALPNDRFRVIDPPLQAPPESVHRLPGPGIEILSSGTTGPPKRLFHPINRLFRSLDGMPPTPNGKPELVIWPVSGIGGNMALASAMIKEVPFILLEKFTVEAATDAIKRHQLPSVALTPTMVRMLYDANVPPEELSSLQAIVGGSGPLDPDLQDKVEKRYGVPIIWAMGATEFCGTIIAWSRELHHKYRQTKRGSAGRVLPGCRIRIVDQDSGKDLPTNEDGRLVVQVDAVGPDWMVTNDLAHIDEDGFVFFTGRADSAIIRGGFKIVPEKLCEVLRTHPKVAEAAVVGIADERLGQLPVAVVERRPGEPVEPAELETHMRARLASPQIPVRFIIVDALPYTASTKVSLGEVRRMVAEIVANTDPRSEVR
jgi:long-chain acyl-CoA synthetase